MHAMIQRLIHNVHDMNKHPASFLYRNLLFNPYRVDCLAAKLIFLLQ